MMRSCLTEVTAMPNQRLIERFIQNSGDVLTSKQATEAGFHRSILSTLVKSNELVRVSHGIYMKPSAWKDEMYLLQCRFNRGIFSHETALYLHGYTDMMPARFVMTFPWGYNAVSLKNENVTVKRAVNYLYGLGIIELTSPVGGIIQTYDIERTLCDIARNDDTCDVQTVNQSMKRYAESKRKDTHKLINYAEKLRTKKKILNYMETMM